MQKFERKLIYSDVKWGLISLSKIRENFPSPGVGIIVYDDEGREYKTKMHTSAARIDGLTQWYKNHPAAKIGDGVEITINLDGSIKLSLVDEMTIVVDDEPEVEPIVIKPSTERLLEDFLEANLKRVEDGLRLYCDDNGVTGRQYSIDVGIVDLLCVDKEGNFVIIEVKKGKGSDQTVGQITRYMGWVKKMLAGDKDVRGIIVVSEIDEKLEYSASVFEGIVIRYYKIELSFVSKEEMLHV